MVYLGVKLEISYRPGFVALQRLPIKASADGFLFDGPGSRGVQEA